MRVKKDMSTQPILVLDSGVGGLTVLRQLIQVSPNEDFVYFADFDNAPYGRLSKSQLRGVILARLLQLNKKYKPKSIVLACNTATASTIQDVREQFPHCIIVGTEPAIKPALRVCNKVLLLGTMGTMCNSGLVRLVTETQPNRVITQVMPDLATQIDKNIANLQVLRSELALSLSQYVGKVDGVVLGCTHYLFVKDLVGEIFGSNVSIFDGNLGVTNRVNSCLKLLRLNRVDTVVGTVKLLCTRRADTVRLYTAWRILQGGDI